MLPDISGEEVEQYLVKQGLVGASAKQVGVPINAPCSDAQHAAMAMGQQPAAVNLIKS
jgi:monothiol glutaredoxin